MVQITSILVQALLASTVLAALPPDHIRHAFVESREARRLARAEKAVSASKTHTTSKHAATSKHITSKKTTSSKHATATKAATKPKKQQAGKGQQKNGAGAAVNNSKTSSTSTKKTSSTSTKKTTSTTSTKKTSSTTSTRTSTSSTTIRTSTSTSVKPTTTAQSTSTSVKSSSKSSSSSTQTSSSASSDSTIAATVYSENWSGAVLTSPPSNSGTFNYIAGTWTLPTVSPPESGSGTWYSSEWVGLDGYTCSSAIFQAGTFSWVEVDDSGNESTGATAWYEWYPNAEVEFSDLDVAAGQTVTFSLRASSTSSGVVAAENLSTGQSVRHTVSAPSSSSTLCGANAEWILEDFSDGDLVPFSAFTEVDFTACVAGTTTGATVGLSGASVIDIVQNNELITNAVAVGSSTIKITYTGPTE